MYSFLQINNYKYFSCVNKYFQLNHAKLSYENTVKYLHNFEAYYYMFLEYMQESLPFAWVNNKYASSLRV